MTEDTNELFRRQQARKLAEATLKKAAGPREHVSHGTYLTTSFKKRDDLPEGASLRKMSDNVVHNLAEIGLHEPVSLQVLPGRWWKVNVDGAEVGRVSEYGCCYVTLYLSSERLAEIGYEVIDGPFNAWANKEVSLAILNENLEKYWDATISNRPLLPVIHGAEHYFREDKAYTSNELLTAIDAGKTVAVHSGPFDTEDDAHYALDLRWESPE